ncbi:hypothetical protein ACL02O_26685 [Micromonospora sp. MS34]|uniref:hypothetical protein n=1 Tax=Micromonospora sp. MS34 TaxID=3385971 RepID=UPI0039A21059
MEIPESLRWTENDPTGRAWRAVLPDRLAECVERWDLRAVAPPFGYAFASLAVPVEMPDGTPVVLKQCPDDDRGAGSGRRRGRQSRLAWSGRFPETTPHLLRGRRASNP